MTELLKIAIASGQVSAEEIEAHRVAGELRQIYESRIEKPQTLREIIDGASDEQAHVWCKVSDVRAVLDDVKVYRQAFADALAAQPVQPAYPVGQVVGPCVCGSWPGGECLKCTWQPAQPAALPARPARYLGIEKAAQIMRDRKAGIPPTPAQELTGCACRWSGAAYVEKCELHEAWDVALHEWADRAKSAEAKLSQPAALPAPLTDRQINTLFDQSRLSVLTFARSIEKAHGIGAKP